MSRETCIPTDQLPPCWSDDVRMNALFAPFRLKSTNPESWDMKVKFWSDALKRWCKWRREPTISASAAASAFVRNGRTPACIDIVVEECLRNGELALISKYLQVLYNNPEGWIKWGARLAFKPAAIAATAITSLLPSRQAVDNDGLPKASIDPSQRFVIESVVKEQATDLLRDYPSGIERIGTVKDLMENTGYPSSKRESFEILLGYLVMEGLAVKKGDMVKLSETASHATPITESDEAFYRLVAAEKKLIADAEKYHRDAERALEDARVAMKLGNKVAAKNHLRRKHKMADRATGCDNALENVRHLLHNMKQMDLNATVVTTYKMSAEAMKKGMQDAGISEDSAHDTMDELKEVLETYDEVGKALAGSVDDCDVQELEQELSDLLSGAGPSGGTPVKGGRERAQKPLSPKDRSRKSEREFVFDGEERILAELNDLSVEDSTVGGRRESEKERLAVGEWGVAGGSKDKPTPPRQRLSKLWYPPQDEFLRDKKDPWTVDEENNLDKSFDALCNSYDGVRLDERLHPGQKLSVSFKTPPQVYAPEFQVQDYKLEAGVCLYNKSDPNQNNEGLQNSTEYYSAESPGKLASNFQMAPGMERNMTDMWHQDKSVEDLERRLNKLKGFNL